MKPIVLLLLTKYNISVLQYPAILKTRLKHSGLTLLLLILSHQVLVAQHTNSAPEKRTYQYFDADNNVISESSFLKKQSDKRYYIITSDSLGIQKLTETNQKGTLDNKAALITHLETLTGQEVDAKRPIIIIYHPGKDPCNSSGSATKASMKAWFDELEEGTRRIAKVKPIYISKVLAELEERDKVITWHEDKEYVIENQFFKYHYPCSSYVIIATNGKYYSQFGEFGKESVWMMVRKMK